MKTILNELWTPPDWFADVNRRLFGTKGGDFVETLPATLADLSRHWNVEIGEPYSTRLQNFVAPAIRRDGTLAVLKISADKEGMLRQIETLARFDGNGAVRLLEADLVLGAMLTERVVPGSQLKTSYDDETSVFIALFRRLWHVRNQTPSEAIPGLNCLAKTWLPGEIREMRRLLLEAGMDQQVGIVDQAEKLLGDLVLSYKEDGLLHGDLQAGNVLSATREPWLSIDPMGLFGEWAFDASTLFRGDPEALKNAAEPNKLLSQRLRRLANELGLDPNRIRAWGLIQAVYCRKWLVQMGWPVEDWSLSTKFLANGVG